MNTSGDPMKHKARALEFDYGTEDFALAIETTTDGERIQRENEEKAKAKAEAEKQQEKLL